MVCSERYSFTLYISNDHNALLDVKETISKQSRSSVVKKKKTTKGLFIYTNTLIQIPQLLTDNNFGNPTPTPKTAELLTNI